MLVKGVPSGLAQSGTRTALLSYSAIFLMPIFVSYLFLVGESEHWLAHIETPAELGALGNDAINVIRRTWLISIIRLQLICTFNLRIN